MASTGTPDPTFGDAYNTFIDGGGALGYGAASLVAGAYTGIALTPALIMHSMSAHRLTAETGHARSGWSAARAR